MILCTYTQNFPTNIRSKGKHVQSQQKDTIVTRFPLKYKVSPALMHITFHHSTEHYWSNNQQSWQTQSQNKNNICCFSFFLFTVSPQTPSQCMLWCHLVSVHPKSQWELNPCSYRHQTPPRTSDNKHHAVHERWNISYDSQKYILLTFSVIIRSTHCFPVRGSVHFSKILCFPPFKCTVQILHRVTRNVFT